MVSLPGQRMTRWMLVGLMLAWLIGAGGSAFAKPPARTPTPPASTPKLDYLRDIRPIFAANCFTCHGQDDKKRQAGLRLDVREAAYGKSAVGHTAIVPGKPESSALYARI